MSKRWLSGFVFGKKASTPEDIKPYSVGDTQRDKIETGPCAEAGCDKPTYGRRLCGMHLERKSKAAKA